MDEIYVYLVDLPNGIREMVAPCADGYTVYIDRNLSEPEKYAAYWHAVGHIERGDWDQIDVNQIEAEAHSN